MYKRKVVALALLMAISLQTQTHVLINIEKKTGKLIYIGPIKRLMYEFTPKEWSNLGLELQLEQIRLDSICNTDYWLRGARRYYKQKFWERTFKNGTEASRAWGIGINQEDNN